MKDLLRICEEFLNPFEMELDEAVVEELEERWGKLAAVIIAFGYSPDIKIEEEGENEYRIN